MNKVVLIGGVVIVVIIAVVALFVQVNQNHQSDVVTNVTTNQTATVTTNNLPEEIILPELDYAIEYQNGSSSANVFGQGVPYIVYEDGTVPVFEVIDGMRIDLDVISASGRYVYFGKGIDEEAERVEPYVFDTENKSLHKICLKGASEGVCNDANASFYSQESALVDWLPDDRLHIEYNDPNLITVDGDGIEIDSLQIFQSVSNQTPWITEINESAGRVHTNGEDLELVVEEISMTNAIDGFTGEDIQEVVNMNEEEVAGEGGE